MRVWQNWQSAQQSLARKREQKARFIYTNNSSILIRYSYCLILQVFLSRLELSGKNDRASALRDEMDEAIRRMDQLEAEFGDLSKLIREEVRVCTSSIPNMSSVEVRRLSPLMN